MNIDVIIVFTYLIGTLLYGLYVGRGVKNIDDYALGGRNFSTAVLAATIFATRASSSSFFVNITKGYEDGLYKLIATSALPLSMVFMAYFIAPRMKEFFGKLSVADMLASIYGKRVGVLASITVFFKSAGFFAIQIKVLSSVMKHFIILDELTSTMLIAFVVTMYSTMGGIRAVTFTDFIQFATFGIAIPLIFMTIFFSLDFVSYPDKQEALFDHIFYFDDSKYDYYFTLFIYFIIPGISGTMAQRMLMARDVKQAVDSMMIAALLLFITFAFSSFIGFFLYVDNPDLQSDAIFPYLIDNYTFTGIRGLFVIGVIAMAMSTADSNLNVGSVAFSHDFCRRLNLISAKNELIASKIFTFICGMFGILFAMKFKDLLDLILFIGSFYLPIVSMPILLAIFGFRSSEKSVLTGMILGAVTVALWKKINLYFGNIGPNSSLLPGMFAHMIGIFGVHYLFKQKGGWGQGPGRGYFNSPTDDWYDIKDSAMNIKKKIYRLFIAKFSLKKFYFILERNLPQSTYLYNNIAFFNCFLTLLIFFNLNIDTKISVWLLVGVLLTSFTILARNLVDDKQGYILLPVYFISKVYCYPFLSTYLLLITDFAIYPVILSIVSIALIQFLMSSNFAVLAYFVGLSLSFTLYSFTNQGQPVYSLLSNNVSLIFVLTSIFVLIKLLIQRSNWKYIVGILKSNEVLINDKKNLKQRLSKSERNLKRLHDLRSEIIDNFSHEIKTPLTTTQNFLELAYEQSFKEKVDMKYIDQARSNFDKLKDYILRLIDLSSYQKNKMIFDLEDENIFELIQNIAISYRNKIQVEISCPRYLKQNKFRFDSVKLKQAFEEIVQNSIMHSKSREMDVSISKFQENNIKILFKDFALDSNLLMDKKELKNLMKSFEIRGGGNEGYRGLGLALLYEIVKSHNGTVKISLHEDGKFGGALIEVILPLGGSDNSTEKLINKKTTNDLEDKKLSKKLRVLIVDDDKNILESTSLILESLGHKVFLANNGSEAIKFISNGNEKIDVMLLDIMMPDKDGVDVLNEIWGKLVFKNIKTIIQSGVGIIEDYQVSLDKFEGVSYCSKPYNKKKLIDAIYH